MLACWDHVCYGITEPDAKNKCLENKRIEMCNCCKQNNIPDCSVNVSQKIDKKWTLVSFNPCTESKFSGQSGVNLPGTSCQSQSCPTNDKKCINSRHHAICECCIRTPSALQTKECKDACTRSATTSKCYIETCGFKPFNECIDKNGSRDSIKRKNYEKLCQCCKDKKAHCYYNNQFICQ